MDWLKIIEKSLDSFLLAAKYFYTEKEYRSLIFTELFNSCTDEYFCGKFHIKRLYDFFDSVNLRIAIHPEYYRNGINWNYQITWYLPKEEWDKNLYNGTPYYGDNAEYPSRIEAEYAAFTQAFLLLEEIIKNK